MSADTFTQSLVRAGSIAGIAGVVSYFAAVFLPLPDAVARSLAFALGPLLGIAFLGLFHLLSAAR